MGGSVMPPGSAVLHASNINASNMCRSSIETSQNSRFHLSRSRRNLYIATPCA
jgi:hypothetical protein